MRITFLLERPTQFEVPFFRFASHDRDCSLRVLYLNAPRGQEVFDPELGRCVSWGFDLLEGYEHTQVPVDADRRWWQTELETHPASLLIINGYTRPPYRAAARAARRLGVRSALRIDSVLWDHGRLRRLAKHLLFAAFLKPLFPHVLAVGSLTVDYLRAFGVEERRISLFPYAVDHQSFAAGSRLSVDERREARVRWGLPERGQVVLCVAKHGPRESPWDVLRALARLPTPRPQLALAGDGPERGALESYAREHLPETRFLGYVPYGELPRLYAAADLFIHAAQEERWGVSVAEALACGLPVIASSRVGAGYDLIEPGANGFRYELGRVAELARRIPEALALSPPTVAAATAPILARWGYEASWRGILRAAESPER